MLFRSNSVGVEFDTWYNDFIDPYDGNHIGIDLNGNMNSITVAPVASILNDGSIYNAWVDYNGKTDNLEVRFAQSSSRPANPLLSLNVDLEAVLGATSAYVGFSSGTGAAYNDHDILNFTFVDDYKPVVVTKPVPGPLPLFGVAATFGFSRRLRNRIKNS